MKPELVASVVASAPAPTGHHQPGLKASSVNRPAHDYQIKAHSHHILLVHVEGATWLSDVGYGGPGLPLPLRLPTGAHHYAPFSDASGADAYAELEWAAEAAEAAAGGLPVERMRGYRLRLGLPGLRAVPDPAATPRFQERAGYYLQRRSVTDGSWKDMFFFRQARLPAAAELMLTG